MTTGFPDSDLHGATAFTVGDSEPGTAMMPVPDRQRTRCGSAGGYLPSVHPVAPVLRCTHHVLRCANHDEPRRPMPAHTGTRVVCNTIFDSSPPLLTMSTGVGAEAFVGTEVIGTQSAPRAGHGAIAR